MTPETLKQWETYFEPKKAAYKTTLPAYLKKRPDEYIAQVITNVLTNEQLSDCLASSLGKYSIEAVIQSIIRLGLNYEKNTLTQCYVTPKKEKHVINGKDEFVSVAQLTVRAEGCIYIAKSDGIIKSCTTQVVYENNEPPAISSDGSYTLTVDKDAWRAAGCAMGSFAGVIVSIVDRNDITTSRFFPKEWAEKRKTFGDAKMKRNANAPGAWDWFAEMAESKAVRTMLEPYVNESAQLSALYGQGEARAERKADLPYTELAARAMDEGENHF